MVPCTYILFVACIQAQTIVHATKKWENFWKATKKKKKKKMPQLELKPTTPQTLVDYKLRVELKPTSHCALLYSACSYRVS